MVQLGDVIAGRYVIKAEVGKGGMGRIYSVYDKTLEEEVALKTLLPEYLKDQMVLDRFFNEARIARSLSHPNIVRVHDIGRTEDTVYISMEYLKGKSLRKLLQDLRPGQKIPVNAILRIFDALCAALDYAHRYTIHRDIKPENVMILPDGSVKLMDFGISKLMSNPNLTSASVVMGTPHYMSPEQLKNSADVDARADIYSVGVMLYEVITGHTPTGLVKAASETRQEIPPGLDPIIEKCVHPDPRKRYQNSAELRAALRVVRVAFEKGTDAGQETPRANAGPRKRGPRSLAPVGGILLVLVLGATGFGWTRAEAHRRSLLESAALATPGEPSSPESALWVEFSQLEDVVAETRVRAESALQEYVESDRLGVVADVITAGNAAWQTAEAADDPAEALDAGWDALHCYMAVVLWPEGMLFVPPGRAVLGSDGRGRAAAKVDGFFITEREVTMREFAAFCESRENWPWPSNAEYGSAEDPMTSVTHYDALAYVASQRPSLRLPTVDQWSRAIAEADAGERLKPSWGWEPSAAEPASAAEGSTRRATSTFYAYGGELSEWTANGPSGALGSGSPVFEGLFSLVGGEFGRSDAYQVAKPRTLSYESGADWVGFRGVWELPRSVGEVRRLLR